MNQIKKEEQRRLWVCRLDDLEESGMTQEQWCKQNNIAYSTLRYWIGKLKKEAENENKTINWLKAEMTPGSAVAVVNPPNVAIPMRASIGIRCGEFTVEVQDDCDPSRLFDVLRILKAI